MKTSKPPKQADQPVVIAVHLQIGDRVKVGGSTYRVTSVNAKFALAANERPRRQPIKIDPPVTSKTVRLLHSSKPSASSANRHSPSQASAASLKAKKRRAKGRDRGKGKIVAVSDSGCVRVNYRSAFVLRPYDPNKN